MPGADAAVHVELSADPAFARRVTRLVWVSATALGIIWLLARTSAPSLTLAHAAIAAGWALMPATLALSLRRPRLRYALVVPASLVSLGLVAVIVVAPSVSAVQRVGWILVTTGVLFGGTLGMWFWFRWMPVPAGFESPFSAGRWLLVAAHISTVTVGLAIVALSLAGLLP